MVDTTSTNSEKITLGGVVAGIVKVLVVGAILAGIFYAYLTSYAAIISILQSYVPNIQDYVVGLVALWVVLLTIVIIFQIRPSSLQWINRHLKMP